MSSADSNREVRFQLRGDLQFADYPIGVTHQTVVKDPLKMEYFLFNPFEQSLLKLLRQPRSIEDLKFLIDQKFSEARIEAGELKSFIKRLLSDNLIVADTTGVGASLFSGRQKELRSRWMQWLFGILAIRFRGINPQSFLDTVNPFTKHLFSPLALVLATLAFAIAMVAMFLNAGQILGADFFWHSIQDPRTLFPVALALIVVKVTHELGHAFACRAVGRECNEMGVLFLAFMPCLYCNVSDVWMEPDRRKRMLVSAAGIYVEMLIAVACVPLCLFSTDANLKLFWFTLMTICSVNTLLINGNPLLRYDGYYLLSDAAGVANLYSEAQRALRDRLVGLFTKTNRWQPISWLEFYAVASFVYRYVIVGVIIFTIYMFFVRVELPGFGLLLAMAIGALTLAPTAYGSTMRLIRLREERKFRKGRAGWTLVVGLLLLAGAMMIPIQTSTFAEGEVAFSGNRIVFAPVSGQIDWRVQSGEMVAAGDVIGQVQNRDLQMKLAEQNLRVTAADQTLGHLMLLQSQGIDNAREIELQKQVVAAARMIADSYRSQVQQSTIVAKVDGMISELPQPDGISLSVIDLRRLNSTLQDVNSNSFVSAGEPIAVVADAVSTVVRLNVPERSSKKVAIGQQVKLQVQQYSPDVLWGRVEDVAIDTPSFIERDATEQEPTKNEGYVTVTIRLDGLHDGLMYKANATAIVLGDRVLLWRAVVRFINANFRLPISRW